MGSLEEAIGAVFEIGGDITVSEVGVLCLVVAVGVSWHVGAHITVHSVPARGLGILALRGLRTNNIVPVGVGVSASISVVSVVGIAVVAVVGGLLIGVLGFGWLRVYCCDNNGVVLNSIVVNTGLVALAGSLLVVNILMMSGSNFLWFLIRFVAQIMMAFALVVSDVGVVDTIGVRCSI